MLHIAAEHGLLIAVEVLIASKAQTNIYNSRVYFLLEVNDHSSFLDYSYLYSNRDGRHFMSQWQTQDLTLSRNFMSLALSM